LYPVCIQPCTNIHVSRSSRRAKVSPDRHRRLFDRAPLFLVVGIARLNHADFDSRVEQYAAVLCVQFNKVLVNEFLS
jgi:hypothetical protein